MGWKPGEINKKNMIEERQKKELREKYNPDGSNLRKAQQRMLEMLVFFDDFCKKNNLRYWLDGGTLLGAIRHQGFIPWDDDIDINMPAEDFTKLVKLFGDKQIGDYVLQNHDTDPGYYRCWGVLRDLKSKYVHTDDLYSERTIKYKGLQIDIFPVITEYNQFTFIVSKYLKVLVDHFWKAKLSAFNSFMTKSFYYLGSRLLYPLFHVLVKKKNNRIVFDYGVGFWRESRYEEDIYPLGKVEFEGHFFNAPKDPLSYCRKIYGNDCMEMPSPDKIYGHQSIVEFL